jgi:glycosyltransferase involved in cell wall biosynthesis
MHSISPRFSIIITTYNRANLLRRALASLSNQSAKNFETFLIDDGSKTRDAEAVAREFHDIRLIYVYQSNQGLIAARNVGIKMAKGDYLCFLDDDDEYFPWATQILESFIESHQYPDFLIQNLIARTQMTSSLDMTVKFESLPSSVLLERDINISDPAFVIKRGYLEKFEKFHRNHDWGGRDLIFGIPNHQIINMTNPPTYCFNPTVGSVSSRMDRWLVALQHCVKSHLAGEYPNFEPLKRLVPKT